MWKKIPKGASRQLNTDPAAEDAENSLKFRAIVSGGVDFFPKWSKIKEI